MQSHWRGRAVSDADGRFRMVDCERTPLSIELFRNQQSERLPTITRLIGAEEDELLLVVGVDDLAECSLRGRLVDPEGAPVRANFTLRRPDASGGPGFPTDAEGAFAAEALPPGAYELTAIPDGCPYLALGRVELLPRERRDLGVLRLETPGRVRVTVEGRSPAESAAFRSFQFKIEAKDDGVARSSEYRPAANAVAPIALHPGRYVLRASANTGFANEVTTFEIASGEERTVDIAPRPGRECNVRVAVAADQVLHASVHLRLSDEVGRLLDDETYPVERSFAVGFQLAAGHYRLEAMTPDGRSAREEFDVVLDESPLPLELAITLR